MKSLKMSFLKTREDIILFIAPFISMGLLFMSKITQMESVDWLILGIASELLGASYIYWIIIKWYEDEKSDNIFVLTCIISIALFFTLSLLFHSDVILASLFQNMTNDSIGVLLMVFILTKLFSPFKKRELNKEALANAMEEIAKNGKIEEDAFDVLRRRNIIDGAQTYYLKSLAKESRK